MLLLLLLLRVAARRRRGISGDQIEEREVISTRNNFNRSFYVVFSGSALPVGRRHLLLSSWARRRPISRRVISPGGTAIDLVLPPLGLLLPADPMTSSTAPLLILSRLLVAVAVGRV